MNKQKIIEKICKCLRLSGSCNANEAASALRQAKLLMNKYNVTEEQLLAANVGEACTEAGSRYNPPFWVLALSNVIAQAFECRVFISRSYGRQPKFHFIGMDFGPEVATYTFSVLSRHLEAARESFVEALGLDDIQEAGRRGDVFAQAWLFRVTRSVAEFVGTHVSEQAIDKYISEHYGEKVDILEVSSETEMKDYADILCGMQAANKVSLYRSMDRAVNAYLPVKQYV